MRSTRRDGGASRPGRLERVVCCYNTGMSTVSFQDLQQDPASFLARVEAGEHFVVVRGGRPVAELRPVAPASPGPRPFGLAAGAFTVPDDFDAPLPDDVLR